MPSACVHYKEVSLLLSYVERRNFTQENNFNKIIYLLKYASQVNHIYTSMMVEIIPFGCTHLCISLAKGHIGTCPAWPFIEVKLNNFRIQLLIPSIYKPCLHL